MLSGLRCIVFGASGGIGSALARSLTRDGARVLLAGRSIERLQHLADELGQPTTVVDAALPESFTECFAEAQRQFGGVDGVANCIGSVLLKPAHATSDSDFQQVLMANLGSSFAIVRGAGQTMRPTGGSVVLVSTAAVRIGLANHEAIAAAKGGVEGLVRAAAATYAGSRLRFNAVAPGLVKTEMTRRLWQEKPAADASEQMHALGRLGEPEDVAQAISFLLSPASAWITGQVLGVDGGLGSIVPRRKA